MSPVGIVVDGDRLVVGGGEIGTTPHTVFTVGLDGHVQPLVEVPDSLFLNGFTPARAGRGYCVDSLLGAVFETDTALFVTTTGGVVMPVDDVPREAKLVRLEVARRGRPLTVPC